MGDAAGRLRSGGPLAVEVDVEHLAGVDRDDAKARVAPLLVEGRLRGHLSAPIFHDFPVAPAEVGRLRQRRARKAGDGGDGHVAAAGQAHGGEPSSLAGKGRTVAFLLASQAP